MELLADSNAWIAFATRPALDLVAGFAPVTIAVGRADRPAAMMAAVAATVGVMPVAGRVQVGIPGVASAACRPAPWAP